MKQKKAEAESKNFKDFGAIFSQVEGLMRKDEERDKRDEEREKWDEERYKIISILEHDAIENLLVRLLNIAIQIVLFRYAAQRNDGECDLFS